MAGVGKVISVCWWALSISVVLMVGLEGSHCAEFSDFFYPSWAEDHVMYEGQMLKLKLDNTSGAGFASKNTYLFGKAHVQIKLVPGDSAGTVTAFYMSSQGAQHDEFDFEFLGNKSGEPYIVQTNVYSQGVGNREQRLYLWFDPTQDFHSYSFLWNRHQVVFMVDDVPVRVFENKENETGVSYPQRQAMGVYSSIWNADDWATQGGLVKTDWSHAPFIATYRNFSIDACEYKGPASMSACSSSSSAWWWDQPAYASLDGKQSFKLRWVHDKHMIYDYCRDSSRFPMPQPECARRT
ncbi:hypothetical protein SUGI_0661800 [Cryptomeria japonica]|uniref:xyloglucan endotransglucosylase protein 6 n=1 Tax=Cryptomeria japonica TaxID=3369 RepID=UPI00241491AB|nr:xyloglucan endotransglucosylase protein 6 [Cryptomeria japonica]GLJ32853.1 hypothetical protein SUGI_0661800 [Cryptomeria japonica]